jgi:phosphoserine phosphatase
MSHVATLISNPARPAVTEAAVAAARAALPDAGTPGVLAPTIAVDIPFGGGSNPRALTERVRKELGGAPVDVVIQPVADRRKRLFVTDMDSTMIEQECIDELADYVGLKPRVAAITERAMRGEIEFEPALRERVQLLRGLPVSVINEVIEKRVTLAPGGRTLVATMRANGAHTCLVSGGFTLFTEKIARMLGFNEQRANRLVIENGKLNGRVEEPILGREAKLAALRLLTERLKLRREQTLAAGDGANDLPMIEAAGLGVAFQAKPVVAAAAHARIDHGDLTALLYLQGYRREEFVETPPG